MALGSVALARPAVALDSPDWPRTGRTQPWLVAALIVVVFLVPIDSVNLPIPLPADAKPDRVLLLLCVGTGLLIALTRPPGPWAPAHRYGPIDLALLAFFAAAVFSVALDLGTLQVLNEVSPTIKRFALLISYVVFYLVIVTTVRSSEAPAFVVLIVTAAALAGAGTILQNVTQFNIFFWLAEHLAPPGTQVSSHVFLKTAAGRPDITGPARHGLADSTMLAMTLPFALVGAVSADSPRARRLYALAAVLVLAGAVLTLRRTGVILPFIASSAVVFLGGRRMLPVAIAFVVLLVAAPIVIPSTVSQLRSQFSSGNVSAQRSVGGRVQDYSAVRPDIEAKALLGRGYGTYDATRYRYLDNQYLGTLIGVGVIGTALYVGLMITGAVTALRVARRRTGHPAAMGLAAFGSIVAFAISNALFDTLSFPQAPYCFLLVLAIVAVLRVPAASGQGVGHDLPGVPGPARR